MRLARRSRFPSRPHQLPQSCRSACALRRPPLRCSVLPTHLSSVRSHGWAFVVARSPAVVVSTRRKDRLAKQRREGGCPEWCVRVRRSELTLLRCIHRGNTAAGESTTSTRHHIMPLTLPAIVFALAASTGGAAGTDSLMRTGVSRAL